MERPASELIALINQTLQDKLKEAEKIHNSNKSNGVEKVGQLMDKIKAMESKESKDQVAQTLNLSDFEKLKEIEDKLKDLEKIKDSEIS